jgi:hypothetical protein
MQAYQKLDSYNVGGYPESLISIPLFRTELEFLKSLWGLGTEEE